jgi:hypothetical protein
MAPFKRFLKETEQFDQLLNLAIQGISMIRAMPKIVDSVALAEGREGEPEHTRDQKMAEEAAALARTEVEQGFPLLLAHNVVALWSLLEALIRTFVAEWVANYPEAMWVPAVSKLKITLGEYHSIPDEEKPLRIAELLEEGLGAGLKRGVNRYEAILKPFGLDGEVAAETKKAIYELGEIRNAIVHRGGRADRRLAETCPWLDVKPGENIIVSRDIYARCFIAVHNYVVQLVARVGEKFGVDMSAFKDSSGTA